MSRPSRDPDRAPAGVAAPTVTGELRVMRGLQGSTGTPDRDILVHLPAGALAFGPGPAEGS